MAEQAAFSISAIRRSFKDLFCLDSTPCILTMITVDARASNAIVIINSTNV